MAAMTLDVLDPATWRPRDVATLLFVIRGGQVLLIRKKRGLGAGKINAPGGRLEPGETARDAAVREVREELGVTPLDPRERGELRFQFVDGYALECHVFSSDDCEGEAHETDEAVPLWTPLDAIPYAEMWQDDALWMPLLLSGQWFSGRFVFDGDRMLAHEIVVRDPARGLFERLDALGIAHVTRRHPPVFTVTQARRHRVEGEGAHVKNLFLRDKKGAMWLVTTLEDRPLGLKNLARTLGAGSLTFASTARLRRHLGVEPGSVTPFAALNDREGAVTVVLDAALLASERVSCHPLTNDRTTTVRTGDLVRLLEASGHAPRVVALE